MNWLDICALDDINVLGSRIVSGPSIGLPTGIQMNMPTRIRMQTTMRRVRRRSPGFEVGAAIKPERPLSPRGEA